MVKQLLIWLLFFSLTNNSILAQLKNVDFVNITQQDGLPTNETYCVFKDSKNYIWIATDQGVVRHKGSSMQIIPNLPDRVVFKIREDAKGKVWFFSYSGKLAYFENDKLYEYSHNSSIEKKVAKILLNEGYISSNDDILQQSTNIGEDCFVNKAGQIEWHNLVVKSDTCFINIDKWGINRLIVKFRNQLYGNNLKCFIITRRDVRKNITYYLPLHNFSVSHFGAVHNSQKAIFFFYGYHLFLLNNDGSYKVKKFDNKILSIFYDSANKSVLIGLSKGGIISFDDNLKMLENFGGKNSVSSITKDNQGELWFSTLENGVYYSKNKYTCKEYIKCLSIIPAHRVLINNDSSFFFANTDGVHKVENKKITPIYKNKNFSIGDLVYYNNKIHLFSIPASIKNTTPKNNKVVQWLCDKEVQQQNNEWCYYNYGGINVINKNNLKFTQKLNLPQSIKLNSILFKDNDHLWLGTQNNLSVYNIRTNNIISFSSSNDSLFTKGISCLHQMKNKIYGIGIVAEGLVLMRNNNIIAHITQKDGLLSNDIKHIISLGDNLWLSSTKGISIISFSSYSPVKYSVFNLGENVGFNNLLFYQLVPFKKDVIAATSKGIFKISSIEKLMSQTNKNIPIYISTVSTYLGDTSNITNINLPFNKNRVSINFDAIEFTTPKDVEYFYRIVNTDSTWFSISNPQLILQDLSPGTYKVELKATLPKQGRESEIKQMTITIEKPWWLKTISLVAFALGLIGILYIFTNWRIKKVKKAAQEKNEIATKMLKLEQNALQAQMNPHFIFNCLTGIQQLMNTNNIDEANEYLVTFSRLIRSTLENSAQEYIVLQDEIDYLKQYISLEEKRLTNSLITHFNIANTINTQAIEIPNMMLQPIIENAIRHGIKPLENKVGEIVINFSVNNNTLECIITDNGIGREASVLNKTYGISNHKSFGLSIIKQRLQGYSKLYNQNYSIEITDLKSENNIALGTKVILHLPIKK